MMHEREREIKKAKLDEANEISVLLSSVCPSESFQPSSLLFSQIF